MIFGYQIGSHNTGCWGIQRLSHELQIKQYSRSETAKQREDIDNVVKGRDRLHILEREKACAFKIRPFLPLVVEREVGRKRSWQKQARTNNTPVLRKLSTLAATAYLTNHIALSFYLVFDSWSFFFSSMLESLTMKSHIRLLTIDSL